MVIYGCGREKLLKIIHPTHLKSRTAAPMPHFCTGDQNINQHTANNNNITINGIIIVSVSLKVEAHTMMRFHWKTVVLMLSYRTATKSLKHRYDTNNCTVSQKCFSHNFVKFPPLATIFGTRTAERIKLCEVHSFQLAQFVSMHYRVKYKCFKLLHNAVRLLKFASPIQQRILRWFNNFVVLNIIHSK